MGADRAGLDRALRRFTVPFGRSNVVVAGVDGSESALRAVRWAAEEAVRQGAELRLVHAELPLPAGVPDLRGSARRALHDESTGWMHDAVVTAKEIAPRLEIQARVEVNTAARFLEQESETVSLVAVGPRGIGGFSGLRLGSVAVALSERSRCPVAIVKGEQPVPDAPVVVGVHGTPANWFVVDRAFDEAAVRGTSLVAVHAWIPPLGTEEVAAAVGIGWSELDAARASVVAQRLASCADRHPDVPVERHVVHGSPAHQLVKFAEHAALLVVGSYGDDRLGGTGLGSTSHAVVQHAPSSVLLIRPGLAGQIENAGRTA
ncbi:universal stress protein [Lentzea sp. NPDC092896]|uniref:universal stress protein n=1 Tax=Lentzea sp. NPDC092896 TaxID=3364127 RepID=UPI0038179926